MTQENRENMRRALGIIECVSWLTDNDDASNALTLACEILYAVLNSEGKDDES